MFTASTSRTIALAVLAISATVPSVAGATAYKKLYIANDDHTDYVWSRNATEYDAIFSEQLNYYINKITDPTNLAKPSNERLRFNMDGSVWLWSYKKQNSAAQFNTLMNLVKDGYMSAPLTVLTPCYGGTPAEGVLRSMYYSHELERDYNGNTPLFRLAYTTEKETLPLGLASLWYGSGARYSWKGICSCYSHMDNWSNRRDQNNANNTDVYWMTGRDGKQILMKWYAYDTNGGAFPEGHTIGGYAEVHQGTAAIDYVKSGSAFLNRHSPGNGKDANVIGLFGYGGDWVWQTSGTNANQYFHPMAPTTFYAAPDYSNWASVGNVNNANGKSDTTTTVYVSNELDYFKELEKLSGLPSLTWTTGNEREVHYASLPENAAKVKRSVEKLRAAEAMAALVMTKDPNYLWATSTDRRQLWINFGFYWDHDWNDEASPNGGVPRGTRQSWQKKVGTDIKATVDLMYSNAVTELGKRINAQSSTTRYFAFNPVGWGTYGYVDIPYSSTPTAYKVIQLSNGQEARSQLVTVQGKQYMRVYAGWVMGTGYEVFNVIEGTNSTLPKFATVTGNSSAMTVDTGLGDTYPGNKGYTLTLSGGGQITSLYDKATGKELGTKVVNGRYINQLNTDQSYTMTNPLTSSAGTVSIEGDPNRACSLTLKAVSTDTDSRKHTTRVTVYRDIARIDIENTIDSNFSAATKADWNFAFNFNGGSTDVWHEEVGAVINAKDILSGGHYANFNRRHQYQTFNHFVDMTGTITGGTSTVGVTISSPDLSFWSLGSTTDAGNGSGCTNSPCYAALDQSNTAIKVLAGGQVDGNRLGFTYNGSEPNYLQRFALIPHSGAINKTTAMKASMEHQNPFVGGPVVPSGYGTLLDPNRATILWTESGTSPDVLVWAIKPSEDFVKDGTVSKGFIMRVWNQSTSPETLQAWFYGSSPAINSAYYTTHIETNLGAPNPNIISGHLEDTVKGLEMKTYRVVGPTGKAP